jgi:hypothetical protein
MHFQLNVGSPATPNSSETVTAQSVVPAPDMTEILRQILETQREQLQFMRTSAASHDASGRWRAFLDRWKDDFGGLPTACKRALPHLERAYMSLIADLAAHLDDQGDDCLGNEFALSEFLDRYGIRLNQLGTILSLVGPLAEIAGTTEPKK